MENNQSENPLKKLKEISQKVKELKSSWNDEDLIWEEEIKSTK